jgi:hypothetical protein
VVPYILYHHVSLFSFVCMYVSIYLLGLQVLKTVYVRDTKFFRLGKAVVNWVSYLLVIHWEILYSSTTSFDSLVVRMYILQLPLGLIWNPNFYIVCSLVDVCIYIANPRKESNNKYRHRWRIAA